MANISAQTLHDDVLDRIDDAVLGGLISPVLQQKLPSSARIIQSINVAYMEFAIKADHANLTGLQTNVTLVASINDISTPASTDGISTYEWPANALVDRTDGGLVNLMIDGSVKLPSESIPLPSLRMQATSSFYSQDNKLFHVGLEQRRIFGINITTLIARIIQIPTLIVSVADNLLINSAFTDALSTLAFQDLIKDVPGSQSPPTNKS